MKSFILLLLFFLLLSSCDSDLEFYEDSSNDIVESRSTYQCVIKSGPNTNQSSCGFFTRSFLAQDYIKICVDGLLGYDSINSFLSFRKLTGGAYPTHYGYSISGACVRFPIVNNQMWSDLNSIGFKLVLKLE